MQKDAVGGHKSVCFNLVDGAANALALSKDSTHVVVAGRNGNA